MEDETDVVEPETGKYFIRRAFFNFLVVKLKVTLGDADCTLVSLSMVPMMLSKLVFPPPEFPRIITNYPCLIFTVTPLRAATPSNPNRYVL